MDNYTDFASVYDILMEHIPYDKWADYIKNILKIHGIDRGLVLELGCGTGTMTRKMAGKGYDMIGIDISEDMLSLARQRSEDDGILYLCQDMREFELYGTVSAVICVCDSINYMLSLEDLSKVFSLVANYLDPGGLFIFDMDTEYLYEEVLGDSTSHMTHEAGDFIWENSYYPEEMINEVDLTLFIKKGDSLYRKHEENHVRRAYDVDTVKKLLYEAGLDMIGAYHELTDKEPKADSERIYIIAKEIYNTNKIYIE